MIVKQLIDKLREFPENMPVAIDHFINPCDIDNPDFIKVNICAWEHSNYPYDKPSFDYVNLE